MGISAVIRINKSSTVSWHTVVYFVYCANSLWYIVSNESWKAACKVHFLSFEPAQEIVERTMKILNKNINVMNEEGIIIGSGEKERINKWQRNSFWSSPANPENRDCSQAARRTCCYFNFDIWSLSAFWLKKGENRNENSHCARFI